ncbi:MAG: heme ABC exporter ATP-binding protein CcmA [Deltaproteobacteria bacterium]|nr:heme ABC exporter ATP-binding protein CcmA [Deltaproteobacteria bacterium]
MHAARCIDVSKRYGQRWALTHVSMELPAGRSVLLTGPNGAGKTTLLKMLATAGRPTRGRIELFGLSVGEHADALRPRVAMFGHATHLYEDLSAAENLDLVARFTRGEHRRTGEVLAQVGLKARAHSPVRTLSAGMKRRLALGRVLMREPELVLLDEPFTQLDPEGVRLTEELVRDLRRRWVTLVLATHDVERGRALCELHLHIEAGSVGPLTPITQRPSA